MKEQDCLRRFVFESLGVRGEWVSLNISLQQVIQNQTLSDAVEEQLAQALAAVVLLSATIKFEGSLILQAQGKGALKTLVAQSTHNRKIRGLARADAGLVEGTFVEMMGQGRLAITIEPKDKEPYQGVVSLDGVTLADVIEGYFLQSEQLKTRVWLFSDQTQVTGLLLQKLPGEANQQSDWEHVITLADTISKDEMMSLTCETILYRLFNEEKVRLFDPESVEFECSCSRNKIETTLVSLGREELQSILQERSLIEVNCEFCGRNFSFDKVDVENLLVGQSSDTISKTQH